MSALLAIDDTITPPAQTLPRSSSVSSDVTLDAGTVAQFSASTVFAKDKIETFTGEVVSNEAWSHTQVSGGGGGGVAIGGIGVATKGRVSSTTTHFRTFWLRRSDGEEKKFVVDAKQAEFREGHALSVATCRTFGGRETALLYNHATDHSSGVIGAPSNPFAFLVVIGGLGANVIAFIFLSMWMDGFNHGGLADLLTALTLFSGNYIFYRWYEIYREYKNEVTAVGEFFRTHRIRG